MSKLLESRKVFESVLLASTVVMLTARFSFGFRWMYEMAVATAFRAILLPTSFVYTRTWVWGFPINFLFFKYSKPI